MKKDKPTALIVLDGWGITQSYEGNALTLAQLPYYTKLLNHFPTFLLEASSLAVGLPWGEVGNSEVGHMNIGAGFVHYQSLPRINKSIKDESFFENPSLLSAINHVKKHKSRLHIMGLLGRGAVHASQDHLDAVIECCRRQKMKENVFFHLFLDGRDSARDGALSFVKHTQELIQKHKLGKIGSLSGRFYAMDRNNNWDRTQKAYRAIVEGVSEKVSSDPVSLVQESYASGVYDEEFIPSVIVDQNQEPVGKVGPDDAIIFFNYRADRARQLTESFLSETFKKFDRPFFQNLKFVSFVPYRDDFTNEVLFPKVVIQNPIAKVVSEYKIPQLHIAETEKYAHVTFFINGQNENKYPGEDRILIPSPAVPTYDIKPEMSAFEVTKEILDAVRKEKYGFYIINFANPDMVGHTGNIPACIKAVETVDTCLGQVVDAITKKGGSCFILGDHGNVEELVNKETGKIDKEHSVFPVPFVAVDKRFERKADQEIYNDFLAVQIPTGVLADVAPTILANLGLEKPKEMTGLNLLEGY